MDPNGWDEILDIQDRQFLRKERLQEHDQLLDAIRSLSPTTGIIQNMFCNSFMFESVELLKHALFLYENGFFDCAFYCLRQSVENMDNMLLLANDKERLKQWESKAWFPVDNKVKELLCRQNDAYSEIKEKIPEFFARYDELLGKANKYIHKQGYDTFYTYRKNETEKEKGQRTNIFVELIKQVIGMILIMDIALDPLSLALSDPDVDSHIPFDPMTEAIPVGMFEEFLSADLICKIKETTHYKTIKDYFMEQEQLSEATYGVLRFQHYDVSNLDDIEKQAHLLSLQETLMLCILHAGIKASHFYGQEDILGYSTTYEPKKQINEYRSNQFENYLEADCKQNISWRGMFISVFKALDSYMIIQHNDPLNEHEISVIEDLTDFASKQYQECLNKLDEIGIEKKSSQ